jgi:hypothetical protein
MPTRRLPPAADQLIGRRDRPPVLLWGRFDVRIDGRQPLLRVVERDDELALALLRHRHRRPGDLRHPARSLMRSVAFPTSR